jgi:hypothetical protein
MCASALDTTHLQGKLERVSCRWRVPWTFMSDDKLFGMPDFLPLRAAEAATRLDDLARVARGERPCA